MSGIKGREMPPRESKSGAFNSLKQMIFTLFELKPKINYEEMGRLLLQEYPETRFNESHFRWYHHHFEKLQVMKKDAEKMLAETLKKLKGESHETRNHASNPRKPRKFTRPNSNVVGKPDNRTQDRRSSVNPTQRKMAVSAGKDVL